MNNEIKEILDNPKILMLSYGNYISLDDYVKLKDYITNLQEENKQLKELEYKFFDCSGDEESFTLEDYLELGNKLYDLQEENERLSRTIVMYDELLCSKNNIIDKAIEYIKESLDILKGDSDIPIATGNVRNRYIKPVLNILKGEDKE